jgi:nitrite reductase/ring-hydroxylating ferredoxin subunit/uncharacterized membrane protein
MTATARRSLGHELYASLAAAEGLDRIAAPIAKLARDATRPQPLKDILSGTWLGHPVHPLLVALPIGLWSGASLLDLIGGAEGERAADQLIGAGLVSTAPTVATGYSDWGDTTVVSPSVRRAGLVHALANATAIGLMTGSLVARGRGARGRGKALALAGLGAVGAGGWLGGHLSYAEGVGVDVTVSESYPTEWTRALDASALAEGEKRRAEVDGTDILLVRQGGRVHALSNTCCHRGGPLDQGELGPGTITCPWHHSTFQLTDGSVERGPAVYPQPALEVREVGGAIEVRAPREP